MTDDEMREAAEALVASWPPPPEDVIDQIAAVLHQPTASDDERAPRRAA